MDDILLDERDMKTRPCSTCEAIIQDCLDGFKTKEEDDDQVAYMNEDYEYKQYPEYQADLDDS
jgi:hypothetical protein